MDHVTSVCDSTVPSLAERQPARITWFYAGRLPTPLPAYYTTAITSTTGRCAVDGFGT